MLLHGEDPAIPTQPLSYEKEHTAAVVDRLLQLAIVVDKYGAAERLRLQSTALLFSFLDCTKDCRDHWNRYSTQLVNACYLFTSSRCFSISTERLTTQTTEIPDDWPNDAPEKMIPGRVYGKLIKLSRRERCIILGDCIEAIRHKRLAAQVHIVTRLPPIVDEFCQDGLSGCASQARARRDNEFELDDDEEWPGTATFAIEAVVEKLQTLKESCRCEHGLGYVLSL